MKRYRLEYMCLTIMFVAAFLTGLPMVISAIGYEATIGLLLVKLSFELLKKLTEGEN